MTESDRANYWWMELQNMEEDCGLSTQSESESFPLGMVQKILYLRGNVGVIVTVIYILPKRRSEVNDRFSKIFMLVLKAKPWTEWPTQCTIHVLKINLKSFLSFIYQNNLFQILRWLLNKLVAEGYVRSYCHYNVFKFFCTLKFEFFSWNISW